MLSTDYILSYSGRGWGQYLTSLFIATNFEQLLKSTNKPCVKNKYY